jgi:Tol biopolymer transport system component
MLPHAFRAAGSRLILLVVFGMLVTCSSRAQTGAGTAPPTQKSSPAVPKSAFPSPGSATATATATGQIVWTDASSSIVLSNPDGSNQHVVVPNHASVTAPVSYSEPDLSPDGKKIVMAGSKPGAKPSSQLYIAGSDGSAPRRAAESGTIQYSPRWSPDGTQIAYAELEGANGVRDIVVMDADGSSPKVIIGNGDRPFWSPDGLSLLFQSSGKIMVINTDRSQLRALAEGAGPAIWSADGTQVAFQQAQSRGVRVLKTGGTSQTVTDAAVSLQSWSPDGRHLLVIASPSGNPPGNLQVIDAATGAVQQTLASNVLGASWQRQRR